MTQQLKEIIERVKRRPAWRQDGSHTIYKNLLGRRVTVPFHAAKTVHPKILKSILKDADIPAEKLRAML